ncbi:hypothetical protein LY78DRAFT_399523 [Colletotrichum sublineola]|nr:hypothetical protein LY78DRAFT_399523 [Colletotrichum sublineola]
MVWFVASCSKCQVQVDDKTGSTYSLPTPPSSWRLLSSRRKQIRTRVGLALPSKGPPWWARDSQSRPIGDAPMPGGLLCTGLPPAFLKRSVSVEDTNCIVYPFRSPLGSRLHRYQILSHSRPGHVNTLTIHRHHTSYTIVPSHFRPVHDFERRRPLGFGTSPLFSPARQNRTMTADGAHLERVAVTVSDVCNQLAYNVHHAARLADAEREAIQCVEIAMPQIYQMLRLFEATRHEQLASLAGSDRTSPCAFIRPVSTAPLVWSTREVW